VNATGAAGIAGNAATIAGSARARPGCGAAARIDRVAAHRLRIPLARPYKLAFGAVTHYDTVVVDITLDDGREGFGEATLLTGYTDETIDGSWRLVGEVAPGLVQQAAAGGLDAATALAARAPFVASAFACALEMALGHPMLGTRGRVPVLGLLQGDDEAALAAEFERLQAQGYATVKVKVGFDAAADARHVARVQRVIGGRARIRVDANQGYDAAAACRFIEAIDPAGIELFEQPCAAGDWSAHACAVRAAACTGLPLMLDESIYALADIERAAAEGACRFLKVKLMKFAGIDALAAAIARIRDLGMIPVLGNGVACDVSCWMEACVGARLTDTAGEMNGFLKAPKMLLSEPLRFERGHVELPATPQRLDAQALALHRMAEIGHRTLRLPGAVQAS
jgi:L-alanine-DL-glutamate epimerase-like enolase superfamily enzyme